MPLIIKTLHSVEDLCLEVHVLCVSVDKTIKTDRIVALNGNKETASLRRKSMDLTRLLADLRQGR